MAWLKTTCPDCGVAITALGGEHLQGTTLWWSVGYRCANCGAAIEENGPGPTPDEVRHAILEQEGHWSLAYDASDGQELKVLTVVRSELNLPLSEIPDFRRLIPGVIHTGTHSEVLRLAHLLEAAGIAGLVVSRATDATPSDKR